MDLIIMCGLPFSGKTTLSNRIAEHAKYTRISFDELWLELEANMQSKSQLSWDIVIGKARQRIAEYLKMGESVVYDDTNARKEHREALTDIARDNHARSRLVYLDIPKEIILGRRRQNLSSKSRHDVENDNFNSMLSQFEEPGPDEEAIIFNLGDGVEKWLEDNFSE